LQSELLQEQVLRQESAETAEALQREGEDLRRQLQNAKDKYQAKHEELIKFKTTRYVHTYVVDMPQS
jgi:hypothetical protein